MFIHRAKYVWQYVYQNIQKIKRVCCTKRANEPASEWARARAQNRMDVCCTGRAHTQSLSMRLKRFACSPLLYVHPYNGPGEREWTACSVALSVFSLSTLLRLVHFIHKYNARSGCALHISKAIHTPKPFPAFKWNISTSIYFPYLFLRLSPAGAAVYALCRSPLPASISHASTGACVLASCAVSPSKMYFGGVPPSSGCLLTCCCWYFS